MNRSSNLQTQPKLASPQGSPSGWEHFDRINAWVYRAMFLGSRQRKVRAPTPSSQPAAPSMAPDITHRS
jgi:hypothetical protein